MIRGRHIPATIQRIDDAERVATAKQMKPAVTANTLGVSLATLYRYLAEDAA